MGTAELIRFGHWVLAEVCVHTGDLSLAASHVSSYENKLQPGARSVSFATFALTAAHLTAARLAPPAAGEEVRGICAGLADHKAMLVMDPTAAAFLVSVSLSAYQRQQAQDVVDVAELISTSNAGVAHLAAAAAHARGLLHLEPSALQTAASTHVHPWARALAVEDLGGVIVGDDLAVARDHFAEATAAYEQLGAGQDAARARGRSAQLAEPRRGRRRRFAPVAGWGSLTDAERKVADHVVDGLSNPQVGARMFISRHTVDFHLRQVFRKLDVHSRVELTRLALETRGSGTREAT
jgi:DNA-binding CsgD family transcriptional regulator